MEVKILIADNGGNLITPIKSTKKIGATYFIFTYSTKILPNDYSKLLKRCESHFRFENIILFTGGHCSVAMVQMNGSKQITKFHEKELSYGDIKCEINTIHKKDFHKLNDILINQDIFTETNKIISDGKIVKNFDKKRNKRPAAAILSFLI